MGGGEVEGAYNYTTVILNIASTVTQLNSIYVCVQHNPVMHASKSLPLAML